MFETVADSRIATDNSKNCRRIRKKNGGGEEKGNKEKLKYETSADKLKRKKMEYTNYKDKRERWIWNTVVTERAGSRIEYTDAIRKHSGGRFSAKKRMDVENKANNGRYKIVEKYRALVDGEKERG